MIMPEANAVKRNEEIATMSNQANYDNTTNKLPVHKWNRSNSFNVTYIPLLERRNNDLCSNNDALIEYVNVLCQNDACSLNSVNGSSLCCCSQRTKSSSSCWHLKRKQIIRQSSNASEKQNTHELLSNDLDRTFMSNKNNLLSKNKIDFSVTEVSQHTTKKSISLPATPNLSHIRRPVRSTYTKLSEQQQVDSSNTTKVIIHMPLNSEKLERRQHCQQTLKTNSPTSNLKPTLKATSSNSISTTAIGPATKSMLLKHRSLRYEETTSSYNSSPDNSNSTISNAHANTKQFVINNINNNNNNASICKAINNNNNNNNSTNKMSKTQGCFLQTCSYENENGAQNNLANAKQQQKIKKNSPLGSGGGGGGSGVGFLRCEHCCESISRQSNGHRTSTNSSGPQIKQHKSTSLDSDHYQCSDSETVSELSSYRFVTDEDIGIVNNNNNNSLSLSSVSVSLSPQSPQSPNENENQFNKRLTECVSNVEENYRNDDNEKTTTTTTTKAIKYETNNFKNKNKNEFLKKQQQPLNSRDRQCIDLDYKKTSRDFSVQTPTNCCYTIDKSHSDHLISHNNNNNNNNNYNNNITKPVNIPVRSENVNIDLSQNECPLSSSLPRNYGSNFDTRTCSFTRQVYIRNSLRGQKTAPPVPPPKPLNDALEDTSSYDPQKFYRKLQKFEKQTTLTQATTTLPRDAPLVRVAERSITPEKCELLNCFPSYRNRHQEARSQNSEISQPTTAVTELVNHTPQTCKTSENGHLNTICRQTNDFSAGKRTLRYDNHGRLKSNFITQLPVTSYRRASLDSDLLATQKCYSPSFNLKLTPTLTRKFQYPAKHSITKEINEETAEEIEEINDLNSNNNEQKVLSVNQHTSHSATSPSRPLPLPSVPLANANLLNSPTLATRSWLPQKKSHSSPIVLLHDRLSSPVWLSTETIESQTSSSQKCLDEVQSNCSDQTTIFHFEHDNSTSSSPSTLLYGSTPGVLAVAGHHTHYVNNNGNIFKAPLLVKRLPSIQSFGYMPTHSSSLGSANVREEFEKEITMEKRRNTLDRFQRLAAFGRKSLNNSNANSNTTGATKNRKTSEKTEKLRELTELLRVGGNRSSPTPPPVPPPRKPRPPVMQSSSQSSETTDAIDTFEETASSSSSLVTATAVSQTFTANEPLMSFMSANSDDILPIDQEEHVNNTNTNKSKNNLQIRNEAEQHTGPTQLNQNTINANKHPGISASLSSPTFNSNVSLSNMELPEKSTSTPTPTTTPPPPPPPPPPPLASFKKREQFAAVASKDEVDDALELNELLSSTHISTKLDKPESRTIIGSYCQKGIPFRSVSFSAIDFAAGKYKKSAWSAVRDRLRHEKTVDATSPTTSLYNSIVDNLTWPRKKLEETSPETKSVKITPDKPAGKAKPDWIYIPLKETPAPSINLCYGQDKTLEDVMESPDLIPEEEVFMVDTIQQVPDKVETVCVAATMVAAHAKMESLTDTIHSENDYIIDETQLQPTVEYKHLQKADSAFTEDKVTASLVHNLNDIFEPNLATLMEEQMPLESPPDNILQTATTCLIPVPVYECAAQEWGMENPPQEWVEALPEKFDVLPEVLQPIVSLDVQQNATQKKLNELVPIISVSRSSDEADDTVIMRKPSEREEDRSDKEVAAVSRQASLDSPVADDKGFSHEDMELTNEKRSSLENITTRHSADERRKADMSKRRKGIYIENWHDHAEGDIASTVPKTLALDITIANLNAIKPDSPEDSLMYVNSPLTDDNRTPASLYSFDLNTPEAECQSPPVWTTKNSIMSSFSLQSSEEKDDIPMASPPVCLSTSHITLPRNNKSYPYLRTDSISDNESDRTPPPSRDRTSPALSDYDFKRYSKRPLRGPYGQMLEAEMKKPNKMHFEEILEDLRESDSSIQPRRQRSAHDDAGGRVNLPHYSNSMRVRKTANNTYLPVPQHTRAASTPSQIENVRSGSTKSGITDTDTEHYDYDDNALIKIKPLEKKCQSTLDTTTIGRDGLLTTTTTPVAVATTVSSAMPSSVMNSKQQTKSTKCSTLLQREQKRASSEAPISKTNNKRSQSMSCTEKPTMAQLQHVHQQKRSLDNTSNSNKINKNHHSNINNNSATGHKAAETSHTTSSTTTNILPTPELLAHLLKGSSEKLLSEQRQQMYADTRTHIVQEIFRNEQSYVESLQTMVNRYFRVLKSQEHAGIVEPRTVDEIFFMVPDILEIHEKFLSQLRHRLDNWDTQQKVGDAFMETFSKLEVLEVYTSFVNNCSRAKNSIRNARHQRPSFAKFLETTAREHKGKLTLDYLLIKPVQKFPNYELLFQRLIKHTDHDHPDQVHLQNVLKLVHDILVHINCKEREILENGQREATLRELEGVIEGVTDLIAPDRQFLLFDLVTMPSGQGARKERGFFLFNDILVLTSIKKRSGTIRKPNTTTCPGTVASTLDTNKYKFLTKISLESLEIVKTKDENLKRIMTEIENLAEDCNKLQQITDITATLKCPHQFLEDAIRELHRDMQRQLSERQTNDAQLNMLELALHSPNGTQKLSIVFSKSEKRTQWEETFNEAKQKLVATLEKHPIPEFLTSIPIRKTRSGLQFTCAAATLSERRDVWVCNSDGYVGQVCIMSLYPEPNVTSCNGVCNARILCIASVPAYSAHKASIKSNSSNEEHYASYAAAVQQQRSSLPPNSYTQQLLDYRKSISPNYSTPNSVLSTPEKKRSDKMQTVSKTTAVDTVALSATTTTTTTTAGNSSDIQLDLSLSSSDEEAEANAGAGSASNASTSFASGGSLMASSERVPSPAPSTQTNNSVSTASTAIVGGSGTLYHSHQDSNPDENDGNQSTMWIGTEDGCIHVYNSTDNIRTKKNRVKIEHNSAVYCILYLDSRVFVGLSNGDICVYLRDGITWNTTYSHCITIGSVTSPVTKLLNVHGRLWCSTQGIIKVLDTETLTVINQIHISSESKPITHMCLSYNYVWISIQNSSFIKCFHSNTHQLITEVNLAQAVNKMLSNCDEIIRQHKAACLRVTSLLACRDLIWIGTSAGVLLTLPAQGYDKVNTNIIPTGIPHGHTGHVRFLTFVETSGSTSISSSTESSSSCKTDADSISSAGSKSPKPQKENAQTNQTTNPNDNAANLLIISGGDGYEDFRNVSVNSLFEIAGREDSTNHLLIWQI